MPNLWADSISRDCGHLIPTRSIRLGGVQGKGVWVWSLDLRNVGDVDSKMIKWKVLKSL